MANPDKTCSYPKAAAAKRELNVADRNTTSQDRKLPGDTLASRLATDTVQVLIRYVTYCHVSLRSPRFTTFYKVGHLRRGCRGRFFECVKICPGVHGSHGEIRLSIPFPYVVSRSPRFVQRGLKRGCRGRREHSVNGVLALNQRHFNVASKFLRFIPAWSALRKLCIRIYKVWREKGRSVVCKQ